MDKISIRVYEKRNREKIAEAISKNYGKILSGYFAIDKLKLYAVLTFVITCIISAIYGFFCYRRYEESRISLYWEESARFTFAVGS